MNLIIHEIKNPMQTTLVLSGRLDTNTAPELEHQLRAILPETSVLVLDLDALDYISSAGLRVLLVAQKEMNKKKGQLTLTHVHETVLEVLEVTGFTDILTIV